jgi:hypothetical protein
MKVKQTCHPYNASIEWVTQSLNLIHSCCWTHNVHCLWQFKVVCYLTDDFTRFTWMFFMKIKDEMIKHIKNFVTLMKTDCSDYSLKCLTLTLSKYLVLKNWFTVNDIIWEPTMPYSPEENGVSERLNRTIWTCTSYAQRLWPELTPLMKAIKTAVYIKNWSSTWVLDMTLYEAWTGNISDLKSSHLWYHCLSTHFKKQCQQEVKFEDCSLKCHYLDMKESSIFCV